MKLQFFSSDFLKIPKYQCYENVSSGSQAVPCRQTDKTKLMVAFCILWTCLQNGTCIEHLQFWFITL